MVYEETWFTFFLFFNSHEAVMRDTNLRKEPTAHISSGTGRYCPHSLNMIREEENLNTLCPAAKLEEKWHWDTNR